jgi:hypothetical protein
MKFGAVAETQKYCYSIGCIEKNGGSRSGPALKRRRISNHSLSNRCNQRRQNNMAQIKVFYEPETELLSVFWQAPRKDQLCTELGDGVILIKDASSGEPIGLEVLSYHPGDDRFDTVSVEMGQLSSSVQPAS